MFCAGDVTQYVINVAKSVVDRLIVQFLLGQTFNVATLKRNRPYAIVQP
jgi:hypothetical protein